MKRAQISMYRLGGESPLSAKPAKLCSICPGAAVMLYLKRHVVQTDSPQHKVKAAASKITDETEGLSLIHFGKSSKLHRISGDVMQLLPGVWAVGCLESLYMNWGDPIQSGKARLCVSAKHFAVRVCISSNESKLNVVLGVRGVHSTDDCRDNITLLREGALLCPCSEL